ncbi:hypothetical protein [Rhizobium sp. RAF56]|uniref:hypothetical protein n=1 Tax=Rhizobium sp. RAF56 TaxID=3233062 RepID=UPI003F96E907
MWKFGGDLLVTAFGPASRISRRVVEGEREEAPVSWIRREVQKLAALAGIDDDETNEITYRRYTGEPSRAAALLTVVESELWAAGGGVTRHRVGLTDAGRATMARSRAASLPLSPIPSAGTRPEQPVRQSRTSE